MKSVFSAVILASVMMTAQATNEKWSDMGIGREVAECASHSIGCIESAKTRYGAVSVQVNKDGDFDLQLNGKKIDDFGGLWMSLEGVFSINNGDVVLFAVNSGGTGCPMQMYIVEVDSDGKYSESDLFGTCTDYYRASVDRDVLTVRMPSFITAAGLGRLSPAERKSFEAEKGTVYRWVNSELSQEPATEQGY